MKPIRYLLLLLVMFLTSPLVSAATEVIGASRGVTGKGPSGVLIPLGFEQYMPLSTALMFYNWIAIMLLFLCAAMASQRNMRFFAVILPLLAALFAYFGWMNDQSNPANMWGQIILCGVVAGGLYLKESNKENNGIAGPGTTLGNFVLFMILLQASTGLVSSTQIWDSDVVVVASQYQNVDLEQQMTGISSTGGFLGPFVSSALIIVEVGISALKTVLSIILTVASFGTTLMLIYPFLWGSPGAIAVIGIAQIIVWLLYALFFYQQFWKPAPDAGWV
jgi:hypothetical protein